MDGRHQQVEDCRVGGGASTWPFTNCPSRGTSSEFEVGEAGDSTAFGSKEAAM